MPNHFLEGFGKDIDNYYYFQEKDQNKFENDQWVDSGDNIYYKFRNISVLKRSILSGFNQKELRTYLIKAEILRKPKFP